MDGIAYMSALTTIRIPCQRDIALRGRKARNVLNERNTFKFSFSSINNENTDTYKTTNKQKKKKIDFIYVTISPPPLPLSPPHKQ